MITRLRAHAALLVLLAVLAAAVGALALTQGRSYAGESRSATASAADQSAESRWGYPTRTIEVDVAENGHRFVFDESPVFDDGMPAFGNAFLTQGYIYPAGTLNGENGVRPDGSPQFPDKVIGEWLCRGYFIGDGAHTTEGSWVYTTQLFAFGEDPDAGRQTVVVVGYEGAEVGKAVTGAITGGTGRYATARGEASQELLGINNAELPTMGINKRVSLEVARR